MKTTLRMAGLLVVLASHAESVTFGGVEPAPPAGFAVNLRFTVGVNPAFSDPAEFGLGNPPLEESNVRRDAGVPVTPDRPTIGIERLWKRTTLPSSNWQGVASSSDGTTLVASGSAGVHVSTDSGATWTRTPLPLMAGDLSINWSCVALSSDGTRVVAARPSNTAYPGSIYTSTNSGLSWAQTSAPDQFWVSVASSADGTKLVAAGGTGIYTSANSGLTWTRTSAPNRDWVSVASSSDGIRIVAGSQEWVGVIPAGGVYRSIDGGATWTQTSAPNRAWYSIASSSDGNRLVLIQA
jgi:hypothetical protein